MRCQKKLHKRRCLRKSIQGDKFCWQHCGKRIHIIGCGPSLHDINPQKLKNEICIGVNKSYIWFKKHKIDPKYYVIIDQNVKYSPRYLREINDLIRNSNIKEFVFHSGLQGWIANSPKVRFLDFCNYDPYLTLPPIEECYGYWGDVSIASIQFAYEWGATEIVLHGIDANYSKKINHFTNKYNYKDDFKGKQNYISQRITRWKQIAKLLQQEGITTTLTSKKSKIRKLFNYNGNWV